MIAAQLLDYVEATTSGFITVVVIYAVIQSVISPFLARFAAKNATAFLGGVGLVATFVALVAATALGDPLTITGGVETLIAATVIVWLVTALATLLLPFGWSRPESSPRGSDVPAQCPGRHRVWLLPSAQAGSRSASRSRKTWSRRS